MENEEHSYTDNIADLWNALQSKEDLLMLLNTLLARLYGEQAKPLNAKILNYHRFSSINKRRYVSFPFVRQGPRPGLFHFH